MSSVLGTDPSKLQASVTLQQQNKCKLQRTHSGSPKYIFLAAALPDFCSTSKLYHAPYAHQVHSFGTQGRPRTTLHDQEQVMQASKHYPVCSCMRRTQQYDQEAAKHRPKIPFYWQPESTAAAKPLLAAVISGHARPGQCHAHTSKPMLPAVQGALSVVLHDQDSDVGVADAVACGRTDDESDEAAFVVRRHCHECRF